jgi:hypothetical protein
MGNRYLLNRDFLEPDRDQQSDIKGRTGKTRGDSRFCGEHRSIRSHHGKHSDPLSRYPGLNFSIWYFVYATFSVPVCTVIFLIPTSVLP